MCKASRNDSLLAGLSLPAARAERNGQVRERRFVVLYAFVIQLLREVLVPTASAAVLSVRVSASERALLECPASTILSCVSPHEGMLPGEWLSLAPFSFDPIHAGRGAPGPYATRTMCRLLLLNGFGVDPV